MLDRLEKIVGQANLLTGEDTARWRRDWTGKYVSSPIAVARPGDTAEVSALMRLATETGTPVVPVSGQTGLNGGAQAPEGSLLISLERMNRIREIRPEARIARVEAGVILGDIHDAAGDHGLSFPLSFGAKGSAMVGGFLSTNAGGSNVLRYGNTRDLVLGIEAVLPDGQVLDLMQELHKNNSGYDLRHLMIGAEGTLGIITGAVLRLVPKPRVYATAMVAVPSLGEALGLLNRLQEETGGMVEAFEYMPGAYLDALERLHPETRPPFDTRHEVSLLVELGSTVARDAEPGPDGTVPLAGTLEEILGGFFESGMVTDAVVAQNAAQREEMWLRREMAAEVSMAVRPFVVNDVAVPVDRVAEFLEKADARVAEIAPEARSLVVAHLGDGNVHYPVQNVPEDAEVQDRIVEAVEDVVLELGGSFSAEHGIGLSKLPSMRRRKNPVALDMMRAIRRAVDPQGIMNPGKLLPE
ncbi:FAD-binding protein [Aquicoccus sp. SCR17]|nr:FAD-binding protein [Carideicomes alvinocaridis]